MIQVYYFNYRFSERNQIAIPSTFLSKKTKLRLVHRNWNKQRNLFKNGFWNDPGEVKNSLSENFSADDIQMNILSTIRLLFEQTKFNFVS